MKKNRRNFLKYSALGVAGLTAATALPACSSFDDYLFEDNFSFNEEVLIVGGGISGMYLAHKLRNNHSEFRLFEASTAFGGRIKSSGDVDFGASLISAKDKLCLQLMDELKLQKTAIDKENFCIAEGMGSVVEQLKERIMGLLPYRNFRLRWKLIEISKISKGFELVFENPNGAKHFVCRKLALAIPPSQWKSIKGLLDLPEMSWAAEWLQTLQTENTIKIILPTTAFASAPKIYSVADYENLNLRQLVKKSKQLSHVEIDVKYLSGDQISIDYVYNALKKKLQINYPFQNLNSDQYYDWQQVKNIQGSAFKNTKPVPVSSNYNFQILGDFSSSVAAHSLEGALLSAEKASDRFL